MGRVEGLRLINLCLIAALGRGAVASVGPAWRTNPKFRARVRAGEPIVTVNTVAAEGAKRRLVVAGGGRVRAPRQFTYEFAKRFDRVAQLSGYVDDARFDEEHDRLSLVFKALGHRADLELRVKPDDEQHRVAVEILRGAFSGLVMDLGFTEIGPRETEVSIEGGYAYQTFPFKGLLFSVGMEGVLKMMAKRLGDAVVAAAKDVDLDPGSVKDSGPSTGEP